MLAAGCSDDTPTSPAETSTTATAAAPTITEQFDSVVPVGGSMFYSVFTLVVVTQSVHGLVLTGAVSRRGRTVSTLFAQSALDHLGGIDIVVNMLGGSEAPAGGFAALR